MNKRATPRFPVTLDVAVSFPRGVYRVCTMRDYCMGGMYLLCNTADNEGFPAARDDSLQIEFSNPLLLQGQRFQLNGRVVRIVDNGIGIAFTQQYPEAVAALGQLAEHQAEVNRSVGISGDNNAEFGRGTLNSVIAESRNKVGELIGAVLRKFFTQSNDALFSSAGEAKNNAQQSAFFGAMNELRKAQVEFTQHFLDKINSQFDIFTIRGYRSPFSQKAEPQAELSLVESDELDNWLGVRTMASKLEEKLAEPLEALETRFEAISVNPITLESNPVGPFVLVSIFRQSLNSLVLDDTAKNVLFSTMERLLHEDLKNLYDELNGVLIAHNILPDYTKKLEVVRTEDSDTSPDFSILERLSEEPRVSAIKASATAVSAQPSQIQAAGAKQPAMAPAPESAAPAASGPVVNPINYSRPLADGGEAVGASGNISEVSTGGSGSYQGVQELMRLQQQTTTTARQGEQPVSGYYSSGEVMQALGHLEQAVADVDREATTSLDHVQYLAQSLNEVIGGEAKALNDADREKVSYVGGMFSSILQDHLVPQYAKPWFSILEVPLLKAGLLDDSLLADELHPARLLLNHLEVLGDLLQGDDSARAKEARASIERIIRNVRENVEHDANVFTDALDDLERVEDTLREDYDGNVAKLIAELDKEKELNQARQTILQALNHRLGQREVPRVVLELLDTGWKNLLLRTYLKSGAESSAYKTYLNVIDQLYARLMETMPYASDASMSDETLQEWLGRMLSIVSSDEAKNKKLLSDIRELLAGGDSVNVQTQYVPALVSKLLHQEKHAEAEKPEDVSDDIWQLMLLDAGEMEDGEAFCYRNLEGEELQVVLVWRDDQPSRYVFVDNAGHKCIDLNMGEVANLFYKKVLTHLDEKSLPVTERATYHFLQSLHSQLSFQAQHDELTGLLNRKAFERALDEAFVSAKSGKTTHVLGYVDLDRFNVINTTCGHAEGDVLLGRIARVLQDTLDGDVVIGRLGGDEFGILLKDCSRTNGLKLITRVHDAIREMQFVCENNEFKVTASIGLAEINESSDSSGRILSAVDAATFTAKDMGRDNIQIYNTENARISNRRNILDWVGRINVLFDKNLIQLRCQKIKPLHATVTSLPHYEVLLDVKDEEGNTVPLEEFIVAAERYNRIIDIDTWVVDYVLKWMEERIDKLNRVSAISINLSGSSLGNRKFMEHIESALSQSGFPADKVCFEITETIAINNLDNASRFMKKIKDTGCQFSLDDFGTGTSSYSYLKSLPIDYLKIDGAFVKDIATNGNDYAVVKSINEIGHAMGKKTIAEYVEDEFAYEALKQIGIDYVQGFGVEKPIPLYKLFG